MWLYDLLICVSGAVSNMWMVIIAITATIRCCGRSKERRGHDVCVFLLEVLVESVKYRRVGNKPSTIFDHGSHGSQRSFQPDKDEMNMPVPGADSIKDLFSVRIWKTIGRSHTDTSCDSKK
jgi:hypothetical protein